jgi:L-amino acid N-acyltransferase YncA
MASESHAASRAEPAASITLRAATAADFESIYALFQQILGEGSTYSYSPEEMTRERSRNYWLDATGTHAVIAEDNGVFAGCYALRPNRTARGGHVANASFIVHPAHRAKGVGSMLGNHAIMRAKSLGYAALQFNFVVSVNEVAVKLWKSLGFVIVGTLPKGFNHATKGLVDVYIMHRFL